MIEAAAENMAHVKEFIEKDAQEKQVLNANYDEVAQEQQDLKKKISMIEKILIFQAETREMVASL